MSPDVLMNAAIIQVTPVRWVGSIGRGAGFSDTGSVLVSQVQFLSDCRSVINYDLLSKYRSDAVLSKRILIHNLSHISK